MRVELVTNDSELMIDEAASTAAQQRKLRRGTTAMEYLVMASFVLIISVQQLGLMTGKLMKGNADATNFHQEDDGEDE